MKKVDFQSLKEFEIINIGMITGGTQSSCGNDADRLCSSICPTNGCKHDGCCGSNYDAKGDTACKNSGKETAVIVPTSVADVAASGINS